MSSKNSGSPNKTQSHATRTPSSASDTTPAQEMLSLQSRLTALSILNRATILTSTESTRMPLDHSRASGLPEKPSSSSTPVSGSTLSPSHLAASNSSGQRTIPNSTSAVLMLLRLKLKRQRLSK